MTMSQRNNRWRLLKNLAKLLLLTVSQKREDFLEMTDEAASKDLSGRAKQAMKILSEAMNLGCYIYHVDSRDVKELHEADSAQQLASSVPFLLCGSLYKSVGPVGRQKPPRIPAE